jgi:hypothetical protein
MGNPAEGTLGGPPSFRAGPIHWPYTERSPNPHSFPSKVYSPPAYTPDPPKKYRAKIEDVSLQSQILGIQEIRYHGDPDTTRIRAHVHR